MLNNIGLGPMGNINFNPAPPPPPWNITGMAYSGLSFDPTAQVSGATFFDISSDGTKFYIRDGASPDTIYEYLLAMPYDISTAVYTGKNGDTTGVSTIGRFKLSTDGNSVYGVGVAPQEVKQFPLGTPFDISTVAGVTNTLTIQTSGNLSGLAFGEVGKRLYMIGAFGSVDQYDISVAWDLSTATWLQTLAPGVFTSTVDGMAISPDGQTIITSDHVSEAVDTYTLGTPWDISTATHAAAIGTLHPQISFSDAYDIAVSHDGTKLYTMDGASSAVFEFTLT